MLNYHEVNFDLIIPKRCITIIPRRTGLPSIVISKYGNFLRFAGICTEITSENLNPIMRTMLTGASVPKPILADIQKVNFQLEDTSSCVPIRDATLNYVAETDDEGGKRIRVIHLAIVNIVKSRCLIIRGVRKELTTAWNVKSIEKNARIVERLAAIDLSHEFRAVGTLSTHDFIGALMLNHLASIISQSLCGGDYTRIEVISNPQIPIAVEFKFGRKGSMLLVHSITEFIGNKVDRQFDLYGGLSRKYPVAIIKISSEILE